MINAELVQKKYRLNSYYYDFVTQAFAPIRSRAIAQLGLTVGETVLDFGCGTGLSFALLEQAVGPEGRIIGVELSPAMLAKAKQKVAEHDWENITLIEANAEKVDLSPESVDAVLSFYTHDIMASRQAVERAIRALLPGGPFVIAGSRLAGKLVLDSVTLAYANRAITTPLTARPWKQLEDLLPQLRIEEHWLGSSYIAHGVKLT
jgi:ubiquinone/menaquinone biosynthesis C-methylase UbiE